ncbi:MAG: DUF3426 domain-containing protein [Hahellaceae bacterium]|nr:DUF3426 domain-containing protein [Hahellaceae bacterium]
MQVFNALENLLGAPRAGATAPATPTNPKFTPAHPPAAARPPTAAPAPMETPRDAEASDDLLFQDDPEEDAKEQAYTRKGGMLDIELSTHFKAVADQKAAHVFSDALVDDENHEEKDESWAEKMLKQEGGDGAPQKKSVLDDTSFSNLEFSEEFLDMEQPGPSKLDAPKTAPKVNPPAETKREPSIGRLAPHSDNKKAADAPPPRPSIRNLLDPAKPGHKAPAKVIAEAPPAPAEVQHSTERQFDFKELRHEALAVSSHAPRNWVNLVWAALSLLLLTVLLAQLAWYYYPELAHDEKFRPLYVKACGALGCTLPELIDTKRIKSQNLIVRSHPTARKALIIDALMVNQAPFPQPFPAMTLSFSSLDHKIVAQRTFEPREYLHGDVSLWKEMPVNTPIHISLELQDPGNDAVSYAMTFSPAQKKSSD